MRDEPSGSSSRVFVSLGTFVLVVIILRVGEKVLLPIAIAALLAFLLSPLAIRLNRWGLGRTLSVALTATCAFAVIGAVGWVLTNQAFDLLHKLPSYEHNIDAKVEKLRAPNTAPAISDAVDVIERIQRQVSVPLHPAVTAQDRNRTPVPVEVESPQQTPWSFFVRLVTPILEPLATTLIVIVFAVAILLQREDLRDRFLKAVSASRLNLATQAVNDATERVSRYLGMQLLINACYGVFIGIGLRFIGIPNPLFWGMTAALLRFIPFIGPWIGAAGPLLLALAIDPGWLKLAVTVGLYAGAEFVTANLVEVVLYGASTGLSPLAVMIAAVFWTWIWGPAGLFLSTPITVCVLVLGKYVPSLSLIPVLLGSRPALSPPAQFYHRMLAMDSDEMMDMALKHLEGQALVAFYDEVFIPALIMAEADRHRGTLAEVRQRFIFAAGRELIDELGRRQRKPAPRRSLKAVPRHGPELPIRVFGIPAFDDADELAACMLQHVLKEKAIGCEVTPASAQPREIAARLEQTGAAVAFVSGLPPAALAPVRQMTRHLREDGPEVKVLAGVWAPEGDAHDIRQRLEHAEPDAVALSLAEAVAQIEKMLAKEEGPARPAAALAEAEGAFDPAAYAVEPAELFEVVTRDLAQIFDVPVSLTALIYLDAEFWRAYWDRDSEGRRAAQPDPRPTFMIGKLVRASELMIVEDLAKDGRLAKHPLLRERGIKFYAVMPLHTSAGLLVGSLCVVDTKPREIDESIRRLFKLRAAQLMAAVEARMRERAAKRSNDDPSSAVPAVSASS
jgi:predicted PurR-regulated permease PerM/methylmalonyl-CoA mutase cobalamin-binding subunit